MRIKPILYQWQYGIAGGMYPAYCMPCFRPWIAFWCLYLYQMPEQGEMISPEHYRGVFKNISLFPWNVVWRQWVFKLPRKYRIILAKLGKKNTHEYYCFRLPIKIYK